MTAPAIYVAAVRWPVRSLGPGNRVVVWTQGCSLGCDGCMSRSTWEAEAGSVEDPHALGVRIGALCARDGSGLTISGGEPLQQVEQLAALIAGVREHAPDINVLVYTGYTRGELPEHASNLGELVDCYVAGRYEQRLNASEHWRGSRNQELVVVTERHERCFQDWADDPRPAPLEVSVDDREVTIVGIPAKGALNRLQLQLEDTGLNLKAREWVLHHD